MRKCLSCKVEFVPSATSQKLQKAEMETLLHLPLTTATILYVFEAYCAEDAMSAFNRLTSTQDGSKPQPPTSHDFWLSRENVDDVAAKLGIESVPVIGRGTLYDAISYVKHTPSYGGLMSTWSLDIQPFEAEGIVARPVEDLFNRKGERIICKIKAVDFR
jgi:hypothetical protein